MKLLNRSFWIVFLACLGACGKDENCRTTADRLQGEKYECSKSSNAVPADTSDTTEENNDADLQGLEFHSDIPGYTEIKGFSTGFTGNTFQEAVPRFFYFEFCNSNLGDRKCIQLFKSVMNDVETNVDYPVNSLDENVDRLGNNYPEFGKNIGDPTVAFVRFPEQELALISGVLTFANPPKESGECKISFVSKFSILLESDNRVSGTLSAQDYKWCTRID